MLHPSTTYHEYEGVHLSETTPFGRTVLLKIAKDGYFPLSAVCANITVERDFSCQDVGIDCFHDYRVNGPIVVQIYIECLKCMIDVPNLCKIIDIFCSQLFYKLFVISSDFSVVVWKVTLTK